MTSTEVELRDAIVGDSHFVLRVRNDPAATASSRSSAVISSDAHDAWFAAALADPSRDIFIVECDSVGAGYVRLDHGQTPASAEVSIALLPAFRGKGLSRIALGAALDRLRSRGGLEATAVVNAGNQQSARLFASLGFVVSGHSGDWVTYTKVLGATNES